MYGTPRCAAGTPGLCAIAEPAPDRKRIVFTAVDPVAGIGAELKVMDIDPKADYQWDLSPDWAAHRCRKDDRTLRWH